MLYKEHNINDTQKKRFFIDLIIDEIMHRDARFKNRETIFDLLDDMEINYDWYNLGNEIQHFFDIRKMERR